MTTDATLTPALAAARDALIAEYTTHALRCVPDGAFDAAPAFDALVRIIKKVHTAPPANYVHLRLCRDDPGYRPEAPIFEWKTACGHRPVGHKEAIPAGWHKQDKRNQPKDTGFVLTGPFDELIGIARLYYGKRELPQSWMSGQLSAPVVAYARWIVEHAGQKPGETPLDQDLMSCVEQFALNCGVSLCFDEVFFVGDPPVGFRDLAGGDNSRRPVWSDKQAAAVGGMVKTPDGIWIDA